MPRTAWKQWLLNSLAAEAVAYGERIWAGMVVFLRHRLVLLCSAAGPPPRSPSSAHRHAWPLYALTKLAGVARLHPASASHRPRCPVRCWLGAGRPKTAADALVAGTPGVWLLRQWILGGALRLRWHAAAPRSSAPDALGCAPRTERSQRGRSHSALAPVAAGAEGHSDGSRIRSCQQRLCPSRCASAHCARDCCVAIIRPCGRSGLCRGGGATPVRQGSPLDGRSQLWR